MAAKGRRCSLTPIQILSIDMGTDSLTRSAWASRNPTRGRCSVLPLAASAALRLAPGVARLPAPALSGLPASAHGFHIHEKGACEPGDQSGKKVAGLAAGGHYDPQHTGKHLGPYRSGGHIGDLPELVVTPDGKAAQPA